MTLLQGQFHFSRHERFHFMFRCLLTTLRPEPATLVLPEVRMKEYNPYTTLILFSYSLFTLTPKP